MPTESEPCDCAAPEVVVTNLSVRYRPELPLVLTGVTLEVRTCRPQRPWLS